MARWDLSQYNLSGSFFFVSSTGLSFIDEMFILLLAWTTEVIFSVDVAVFCCSTRKHRYQYSKQCWSRVLSGVWFIQGRCDVNEGIASIFSQLEGMMTWWIVLCCLFLHLSCFAMHALALVYHHTSSNKILHHTSPHNHITSLHTTIYHVLPHTILIPNKLTHPYTCFLLSFLTPHDWSYQSNK